MSETTVIVGAPALDCSRVRAEKRTRDCFTGRPPASGPCYECSLRRDAEIGADALGGFRAFAWMDRESRRDYAAAILYAVDRAGGHRG